MKTENQHFSAKRRIVFFLFLVIGIFSISAIVMFLWNWILPTISPLTAITYWQAMGLLVLCRILFGGFNFHRHHREHRPPFMQTAAREKFMNMTEEEKQEFKNQWKSRCCK